MLTIPRKFCPPWLCVTCAAALTAAGCTSTVPSTHFSSAVAHATGAASPIQFRLVGEAVDLDGNVAPGTTSETATTLTLDDALRRSLSHSPEIQSSLARVAGARADTRQARLLPNPILDLILRFPEGGGTLEVEAGLSMDLISLLSRPGRSRAADNRLRSAASEAVSQVLDGVAEVQQRYVAVQSLDALLGVLEERLTIANRLFQFFQDRLQAGEGTRLDVLTLESQRTELQVEIADRQLERREERLALSRLIGQPSGSADWRVTPWQPARTPAISESGWIALAMDHRPEIQARRYELAALGIELSLTRFSPFYGSGPGVAAERGDGNWAIGPAISTPLPLFDFGQARRARARAAVIEARHNLTGAQREVVEEVRRSLAAFASSQDNLRRVRTELVPLAQQRRDQAEAQFRGGETNILALLIAEEALQSSQIRLVELERKNTEALVRLHRAVGGAGVAGDGDAVSPPQAPPAPATNPAASQPSARADE